MTQPIRTIRKDSRRLVRELGLLSARNENLDIGYARGHALLELEEGGAVSVAEMADRLALDISTVSRMVTRLWKAGLVELNEDGRDRRRRLLTLTAQGSEKIGEIHSVCDDQVRRAISRLNDDDRKAVEDGLRLYAEALGRERSFREMEYRPIRPSDSSSLKNIIIEVSREFGTDGSGGPTADPELDDLHEAYSKPGSAYWVAVRRGRVLGGGGIARLAGADDSVCELQKLYLLPEARGIGAGARLLDLCFDSARTLGYATCYIETTDGMAGARKLYQKAGCVPVNQSLGATGHHQCQRRFAKELNQPGIVSMVRR